MGHRHAVLLIEDEYDMREALAVFIASYSMDVVEAANGREALDRLRGGFRPCFILLDMAMPVMNGAAFRRAQLADPTLAGIPVAVVSAGGWVAEAEAKQVGVSVFLRKPVDVDRLVQFLESPCDAEA